MPRSGRIVAYDALRVFAIASVVAIHTLMPYRQLVAATSPVRVFDDLIHYAVPLFVFLSGALVWSRPLSRERGSYGAFLARRGRVILLPYLAWALFYLVLYLWQATDKTTAFARIPMLLLSGHVWYHLYFIPMLLAFYLLMPVASRVNEIAPELLVLGTYALRIVFGTQIVAAATTAGGDLTGAIAYHLVTHLPHMALGAWFAIRLPSMGSAMRRSWPALLVAGFGVLGMLSAGRLSLSGLDPKLARSIYAAAMAAVVLGFALLAFALEPWLEKWTRPIVAASAASFGVYFVHPLLIWVNKKSLIAAGLWNLWLEPWFPVLVFAIVLLASFAFAEACARHPKTAWLVGARAGATSGPDRQRT